MVKWTALLLVVLLVITCMAAVADEAKKTPVALSYQVYYPSNSSTKDAFGNAWSGFGLDILRPQDSKKWDTLWSFHGMSSDQGTEKAAMVAANFGMQRGLSDDKKVQPFLILQAGPSYGRVQTATVDEKKLGLNADVTLGVLFNKRFQIAARYDVYSKVDGFSFNGFTVSAGIKLFDLK